MAVKLSPVAGAAAQFFDNSGQVLTGGLIYTYLAGTTTPAVTYTSNTGVTPNSNPIVLDAAGRVPYEIWLEDRTLYKFILQTQYSVQIGSYDNIQGINSTPVSSEGYVTASQSQTVVNVPFTYVVGENVLKVYVNGNKQVRTLNYTETSSSSITFSTGLNVGDIVEFTN
jgi:hypothetical protein